MDRYITREKRINSVNGGYQFSPQLLPQYQQTSGGPDVAYLYENSRNEYIGGSNTEYDLSNNDRNTIHFQQPPPFSMNYHGQMGSGIDPNYLVTYSPSNNAVLMKSGAVYSGDEVRRTYNNIPMSTSTGCEYQNQNFMGPQRPVPVNSFTAPSRPISNVEQYYEAPRMFQNQTSNTYSSPVDTNETMKTCIPPKLTMMHKSVDVPKKQVTDTNSQKNEDSATSKMMTREEKLKVLYKSGTRQFSGPVEKVLKWHKSLQEFGILILYEIVAKLVNVGKGEGCAKHLVIRDGNGPAIQVVYYEIDFLLPSLSPPCTIRVIGKMMPGTCRLQAFSIRPATGDDVSTLPRRAAIAEHHISKLCKEYGKQPQ